MESPNASRADSLRVLYWRREILQFLCWIQGEGFGDHLDPRLLERALGVEARLGVRHLDELVDEGLLCCDGEGFYRLTEAGYRHAACIVADELGDLSGPGLRERACGGCGVRPSIGGRQRSIRGTSRSREVRRSPP